MRWNRHLWGDRWSFRCYMNTVYRWIYRAGTLHMYLWITMEHVRLWKVATVELHVLFVHYSETICSDDKLYSNQWTIIQTLAAFSPKKRISINIFLCPPAQKCSKIHAILSFEMGVNSTALSIGAIDTNFLCCVPHNFTLTVFIVEWMLFLDCLFNRLLTSNHQHLLWIRCCWCFCWALLRV